MTNFFPEETYLSKYKNQILELIFAYQSIEMMLCLKLYLPSKEIGNKGTLNALNKKLKKTTLGEMSKNYKERFPQDNYGLSKLLEEVTINRNTFMHRYLIANALIENNSQEEANFTKIIEAYLANATTLFYIICDLNSD